MTFCLHELSQNPDIQQRVRESIADVLEKHDGKITYEALNDMHYLEQCINGEFFINRNEELL
jgi:cytochrome P450 family 6